MSTSFEVEFLEFVGEGLFVGEGSFVVEVVGGSVVMGVKV